MQTFFCNMLSKAINRYLQLDPASKERLQRLDNKTISIELLPFHFVFQCTFTATNVTITTDNMPFAAKIRGTPLQMLGVIAIKNRRQRFFADDVTVEGDAGFAQEVIALFDDLNIDWEEPFSKLLGDIPVHRLSQITKKLKRFVSQSEDHLSANIREYLQEERQWLPTRAALEDFFNDVDEVQEKSLLLEARVANLISALCQKG